jgi:hypothetical protein
MPIIAGIDTLQDLLEADQLEALEKAAETHKVQANIQFSIKERDGNKLYIEASQSETRSKKYATEATLIKRAHEVFDKWLPDFELEIEPTTYGLTPTSVVTPAWLEKKMKEKDVRIKQIAFDTGVDRESIADWVSGKRSMSQIVKAMFFFYLSK